MAEHTEPSAGCRTPFRRAEGQAIAAPSLVGGLHEILSLGYGK